MRRKYRDGKSCPHCTAGRREGVEETPDHLLQCEAYDYLRQGAGDPEVWMEDRIPYLRKVVERRKELEKKLEEERKNR